MDTTAENKPVNLYNPTVLSAILWLLNAKEEYDDDHPMLMQVIVTDYNVVACSDGYRIHTLNASDLFKWMPPLTPGLYEFTLDQDNNWMTCRRIQDDTLYERFSQALRSQFQHCAAALQRGEPVDGYVILNECYLREVIDLLGNPFKLHVLGPSQPVLVQTHFGNISAFAMVMPMRPEYEEVPLWLPNPGN
jgi:hypothetical protein